VIEIVLYKQQC